MKRFRFHLERVLRFRQITEQEAQRLLKLAQDALHTAEARLMELLAMADTDRVKAGAVVRAEELELVGSFALRLTHEIANQRLLILDCEHRVQEAMARYVEARKETRALESVKERRGQQHRERVALHEANELDEFATQRVGRARQIARREQGNYDIKE